MDVPQDIPEKLPTNIPDFDPRAILERLKELAEGVQLGQHGSMSELVDSLSKTHALEASVLVILGVLWLLLGWKLFKPFVMINFAAAGAVLGGMGAIAIGQDAYWWVGMLIGAAVLGVLALPLMKILIGLLAVVIGAGVGHLIFGQIVLVMHRPDLAAMPWIGPIAGGLLLGVLTLAFYRQGIMMLTALQGAGMIVAGGVCLLLKIENLRPKLTAGLNSHHSVMVIAAICLAILGFVLQARAAARKAKPAEDSAEA